MPSCITLKIHRSRIHLALLVRSVGLGWCQQAAIEVILARIALQIHGRGIDLAGLHHIRLVFLRCQIVMGWRRLHTCFASTGWQGEHQRHQQAGYAQPLRRAGFALAVGIVHIGFLHSKSAWQICCLPSALSVNLTLIALAGHP